METRTDLRAVGRPEFGSGLRAPVFWPLLFALTWCASTWGREISRAIDARWIEKYPPALRLPLAREISAAMDWLVEDASFGLFTFRELTRGIAWVIEQPYDFLRALLIDGFHSGLGNQAVEILPSLGWISVVVVFVLLGRYAKDWSLAALVGGCFLYLVVFDQWPSAMVTLASVLLAVPLGAGLGLLLGIGAYLWPPFERALRPVLDLMQTVPVFAYLVPILFLFGFGPVAALVATIVYAMPPMVRVMTLALKEVPSDIREFGTMAGCTGRQMIWKVLVPSAASSLMVGVNQVIMLSLNMVIIASMIGAGGLGYDVLTSLRRLDIGGGVQAGVAIVVMAIALDRLSQAFARRAPAAHDFSPRSGLGGHARTAGVYAALLLSLILSLALPILHRLPESWTVTTAPFWDDLVEYLNVHFFDDLEAIKTFMLTYFLLPVKRFLVGIPWPWGIAVLALIGWRFGGTRLALLAALLSLFIAANGLWDKAMVTLYLCGVSVFIASAIGIPIGVLAAENKRVDRIVETVADTLQTLPSFVYLIPVVMLFRVGDFSAMVAVVLYALAPAVRYAAHGVRHVDPQVVEAGIAAGCTRWQLLTRIKLPLAFPAILLGLNQTIMLAISMLVITALVGTRDLGQEVYIALTKADVGRGIVTGLSIAFMAIIADRILSACAKRAEARLA